MDKVNLNGELFDNDVAVHYMDDEIREKLHMEYVEKVTEQEFLDLYCEEHIKKFGEEFRIN
jgi:anti-CRISPR protein AcrIC5